MAHGTPGQGATRFFIFLVGVMGVSIYGFVFRPFQLTMTQKSEENATAIKTNTDTIAEVKESTIVNAKDIKLNSDEISKQIKELKEVKVRVTETEKTLVKHEDLMAELKRQDMALKAQLAKVETDLKSEKVKTEELSSKLKKQRSGVQLQMTELQKKMNTLSDQNKKDQRKIEDIVKKLTDTDELIKTAIQQKDREWEAKLKKRDETWEKRFEKLEAILKNKID
ncbi:MAG: hypothetical protein P1V97_21285 [Planctomycetota bacterium]|nr:hypothetical protein [Planctomycetota bacterium]